jgi:hypothetical protein
MVIVRVDADTAATGVNVRVVRRGDLVFAAICCVYNEGQKGHCREALTDVVAHAENLPKHSIIAATESKGDDITEKAKTFP